MHKFAENPGNPVNTFVLPFVFTDKVKEAVQSIWRCHNPGEHRLILIDNSEEEFKDRGWLEDNSHFYIRSYRNLGPATAFNLGIEMARTEYVTIISDDARLIHKTWFDNAKDIIIGSTIVSLGSIYPQKTNKFYKVGWNYTKEEYIELDRKYGSKTETFGLATAISRKEVWIKAGLFDESSYIYWIDGMFMEQAKQNGVITISQGVVFHYGDASHKGRLVEEGKYQQIGKLDDKRLNL